LPRELGSVSKVEGDVVSFFVKEKPCLGQIVKIPKNETIYYTRVFKAKSASTLPLPEQLKEKAGMESMGPYSEYEEVDSILFLESYEGEKPRPPTYIPTYLNSVYAIDMGDYKKLRLYERGDLLIGKLRSGREVLGDVGMAKEAIETHIGLFGVTGAGKTNEELVINIQLMERPGTVALIFDFAGQLLEGKGLEPKMGFKDHPWFNNLVRCYSIRKSKHTQKIVVGLHSIKPGDLRTLFEDMTLPQIRLAKRFYADKGEDWISTLLEAYEDGGCNLPLPPSASAGAPPQDEAGSTRARNPQPLDGSNTQPVAAPRAAYNNHLDHQM